MNVFHSDSDEELEEEMVGFSADVRLTTRTEAAPLRALEVAPPLVSGGGGGGGLLELAAWPGYAVIGSGRAFIRLETEKSSSVGYGRDGSP